MAYGLWVGSVNDSISRMAVRDASVRVEDPDTGDLLGLYADRAGTKPLGNPFLTREDGAVKFFARPGRVNIEVYKNGSSQLFENEIILDDDAADPCSSTYIVTPAYDGEYKTGYRTDYDVFDPDTFGSIDTDVFVRSGASDGRIVGAYYNANDDYFAIAMQSVEIGADPYLPQPGYSVNPPTVQVGDIVLDAVNATNNEYEWRWSSPGVALTEGEDIQIVVTLCDVEWAFYSPA